MVPKLVLFSALLVIVAAEKVRYDNFSLYKVHPENEEDLKFLNELKEKNEKLDFWKPPTHVGESVSIVSPPELKEEFEHSLNKRSIRSELVLKNIQEAFDAQLYSRKRRDTNNQLHWTNYQTIEDIYGWFDYLGRNHGNIVTVVTVGQTHEGRNITGIRISHGSSNRTFVLQAGELGADWLSPTVLTYVANELIFNNNSEIRRAATDFVWYIFPLTNPDGFQYSQSEDRLWLKNREPTVTTPGGTTIGVDLTKNWNSQWGKSGGSHTQTDEDYIGLGPFSERETRFISNYLDTIVTNHTLAGFLSFRSFGQRLLIPFAFSTTPLFNYDQMVTIGRRAMGSLSVRYETYYRVGTSKNIYDGATGSVTDWAKYRYNPPVAATYLLRDTGAWGFTLPVGQITPTAEETFDSIIAIIREARHVNAL